MLWNALLGALVIALSLAIAFGVVYVAEQLTLIAIDLFKKVFPAR